MNQKMIKEFIIFLKILLSSGKRTLSETWLVTNSSLAFATMLSIIPLALISLGVISRFSGYYDTVNQLNGYVLKTFVPGVGVEIGKHLADFVINANSLSIFGTAALFVSAGLLLLEIHSAFHKVWDIRNQTPWLNKLLELLAMMIFPPILAISSDWLIDFIFHRLGWEGQWIQDLAPILLVFVVINGLYLIFSPRKNIPFKATVIGSCVATTVFFIAKEIFVLYLSGKTIQNIIYGALSIIPTIQIWLFIFWTIVIYGAMITQELTIHWTQNKAPSSDQLS
jgi:membrane protein